MKIKVRLTREEKAALRVKLEDAQRLKNREWHPYYALLPVRVAQGQGRWLETVERRVVTVADLKREEWEAKGANPYSKPHYETGDYKFVTQYRPLPMEFNLKAK